MKFFSKESLASRKKLIIPIFGVLALAVLSGFILFEATKATIDVTENGEKQTVKTHAKTIEKVLGDLGIVVGEHDSLSHDMTARVEDGMDINYKQAKRVVVTIDGVNNVYYTTSDTIEEFLSDEDVSFSDHDQVSYEANDKIEDGLHVKVKTAYQVTIDDGGKEKQVWTTGGSIEELLDTNGITLNKIDKITPELDKDVDKDTVIKVTRVEKTTDMIEEKTAFKTEKREDSSLAKGKEKIITSGKEGMVVKKYEITMENGEEVDRTLVSEEVKEESKSQVVAIGTKEATQNLVTLASKKEKSTPTPNKETNGSNASGDSNGKVLYMDATAFTANCNGCSGYTATGINLNSNPNKKVIAVDPNVIPLGSTVWVEGYGTAIAGDTGGSIKGNRIDAHVPTKSDAYQFGRKTVKVKVIE